MRRRLLPAMLMTFFMSLALCVYAQASGDPIMMLENVTRKILQVMEENKSRLKSHPTYIYNIVDDLLVPHADFEEMSKWVVGRSAWMKAVPAERERFVAAFKDLVVRTYAGSLNKYQDQTIEYLPLRDGYAGKKQVQVASLIKESGKDPIRVSYRLTLRGQEWKVYDIVIEGVSIVKGFQNQFAEDLNSQGLAFVTDKIKNQSNKVQASD